MTSPTANSPAAPVAVPHGTDPDGSALPVAPAPSFAVPLLLWFAVQLGALAVAAFRVRLSANYPPAGERLAMHLLLAAQFGASAVLFPFVLRDWRSTAVIAAGSLPPLAAAAALASVPAARAGELALFVVGWVVGLGVWRAALRSPRAAMTGSAVAAGWALGGAVLWYLRAEFVGEAAGDTDLPLAAATFGPLAAALRMASEAPRASGTWVLPATVFASGLLALLVRRRTYRGD